MPHLVFVLILVDFIRGRSLRTRTGVIVNPEPRKTYYRQVSETPTHESEEIYYSSPIEFKSLYLQIKHGTERTEVCPICLL